MGEFSEESRDMQEVTWIVTFQADSAHFHLKIQLRGHKPD